jgi:hypothetical protein
MSRGGLLPWPCPMPNAAREGAACSSCSPPSCWQRWRPPAVWTWTPTLLLAMSVCCCCYYCYCYSCRYDPSRTARCVGYPVALKPACSLPLHTQLSVSVPGKLVTPQVSACHCNRMRSVAGEECEINAGNSLPWTNHCQGRGTRPSAHPASVTV